MFSSTEQLLSQQVTFPLCNELHSWFEIIMSWWVARANLGWAALAPWPVCPLLLSMAVIPISSHSSALLHASSFPWPCCAAAPRPVSISCGLCLLLGAALANQPDWRVLVFLSMEEVVHYFELNTVLAHRRLLGNFFCFIFLTGKSYTKLLACF